MTTAQLTGLDTMQLLRKIADSLDNSDVKFFCWPPDDGLQPIPNGITTISFKNNSAYARGSARGPSVNFISPALPPDFYKQIRSVYVNVDSSVFVKIYPNESEVKLFAGETLYVPVSHKTGLEQIELETRSSANAYVIVGSTTTIPNVPLLSQLSIRWGDVTVTKVAAAGTNDPMLNPSVNTCAPFGLSSSIFLGHHGGQVVPIVARTENKSIIGKNASTRTQALQQYADESLICHGLSQKMAIVRNVGSNSVDVQAFGNLTHLVVHEVGDILGISIPPGGAQGFISDTDPKNGNPITIAANTNAIIESGLPWFDWHLRARCSSAVAAGQTSRIIVEMIAQGPGVR